MATFLLQQEGTAFWAYTLSAGPCFINIRRGSNGSDFLFTAVFLCMAAYLAI